jgi:Domain of unknown function (DUF5615)
VSLGLYMDVHVPYAITTELRLRGIDVLTAQQDSATELPDALLLSRALELGRVLVTQDIGFLREAARCRERSQAFAGIIYAPQLRVSIGQCVRDLELIACMSEPEEWMNHVEFLPLK